MARPNTRRIVIVAALGLSLIIVLHAIDSLHRTSQMDGMLDALWQSYAQHDWDARSGRTVDAQNGGVTTSEGEAYTMLRAVWSGDRAVFDKTWQWTQVNLQRPDHLFSWRWDPAGLSSSSNTASDADSDTAFALLMAANKWHNQAYRSAARQIIPNIWQHDVVRIQDIPYLVADDIEGANQQRVVVNPSYAAPYAFRAFAGVDAQHDWAAVADSSYRLIQNASKSYFGLSRSAGLPPDWASISRSSGSIVSLPAPKDTDFGFDAFRTVWRITLDAQWSHNSAAQSQIARLSFLGDEWHSHHKLFAIYAHTGQPKAGYESYAMYAGTLGYFMLEDPASARAIVDTKLLPLYDPDRHALTKTLSYYDNNWLWFGLAMYTGRLPNLAGGQP